MNRFSLIALLALFPAPPAHALSLTQWQNARVLSALRDYCGNAWCEGDFDYKFKSLSCEPRGSTCKLGYVIVKREAKARRKESCVISGIRNFQALLDAEGGLSDSLLEKLDDCFEKAESRSSEKSAP